MFDSGLLTANFYFCAGDGRGRIVLIEIGEGSSDVVSDSDMHSDAVNRLTFSPHQ